MKQRTRLFAAVLACLLAVIALVTPQGRGLARYAMAALHVHQETPPVRPGDRMRTMQLVTADGSPTTFDPAALRGTTVFNVFTSWCPSCRAEAPDLSAAAQQLRARGVRFIGIDQAEPLDVVARLTASEHLPYPVLVDQTNVSKSVLGARMIPTTVVVKDGVVTGVAYGPLTHDQVFALVRQTL